MEWSKLKNIVLLILLGLNLALGILIGGPALSDRYRESQATREAVTFLEQKGILMQDTQLPDPAQLPARVVFRDREEEARLARALLGEDAQQEARGGEVYRYTGKAGVIRFHSDGSFWGQLTPGAFPIGDSPEQAVLDMLKILGIEGEILPSQETGTVTVRQVWEGAHLFNQQIVVLWDHTGITEITSGRRLYGLPEEDLSRQTITLATALIDFYNGLNRLGDVCSRVDEIVPGYLSATSLTRQMELTPVWRITTDTGVYQFDLITGNVERAG